MSEFCGLIIKLIAIKLSMLFLIDWLLFNQESFCSSLTFISLRIKIKNMKSKLVLLGALLMASAAIAQTKLGTIDNDYIINLMPEAKIVVKMSQEYGQKLDSSFSIKMKEYQDKIDDYKKNEKEYGELMKKTMITEIQTMEQEIQKYQENGSKLMQLKQNELMRPLYKKLNDAIELVAKENKFTQILTVQGNQFAYIDEKFDITKLVMNKLGLKEPEIKD